METDSCVREFAVMKQSISICSSHKGNLWQAERKTELKSNLSEGDFMEE